jgi:uncharacterized repeat protein (TIGR01451 family)
MLLKLTSLLAVAGAIVLVGCRTHMPHALGPWPAGGDIQQTHAKPPEGGYYMNWDPFAVELVVEPVKDVNPVRTQHVLVATVKDKDGKPLPNRRVEWMIAEGSVGDIVEVDESGWRASRGYKVDNHYAVSHTNNFAHVLDLGNDDPADDVHLEAGQTWCVITSPIEGDTYITAYAPGIYDWSKHKVFVTKHWYDVAWEFPPAATNPIGGTHEFTTMVMKYSDGTPLAGYTVNYRIVDGPAGTLEPGGSQTASVKTNEAGLAKVTLKQTKPLEGTNHIDIEIIRPPNECDCTPAVQIATGRTSKTWIGPKIGITKTAPAREMVGHQFEYNIAVNNPSDVDATNLVVTDVLPEGIAYVSSAPAASVQGQSLTWKLGTLAKRGTKPIKVQVKGTRTGKFDNCAEVRADHGLSARDCASTIITAPKLALEKECSSEVLICDMIDYRIVVRNTGDGPATNVKISDRLPDGLRTSDGKPGVSATIAKLEPGKAQQIRFQAKASKAGTFENTATATADGGLTAEASCTTVVRQPVLKVTKTGPELRYIGRAVDYEITVSNTGDTPARETVLIDTTPAGTEFVRASDGGRFANGKVTWNLGTLAAGASKKVALTLKPLRSGTIRNTAVAKAYCAEASAEVATEIKGISAILLEVIDVEDPIEIGASETYVITVTNQGSADGTNIVIACTIPAEETYISSTGPTRAAVDGQAIKFAPLASLAPKDKATYRVVVKGTKEGDVRFKVSLTSDQIERPVEETESTHVY